MDYSNCKCPTCLKLQKEIMEMDFKESEMKVLNYWLKYSTIAIDELQQKLSGKVSTEIFMDDAIVTMQPRGNGKSFKLENFGVGSEVLSRMFKESFKENRVWNDGVPANEPKELKAKGKWWNEQALSPVNPIDHRKREKKRSERKKVRSYTKGR